MQDEALSGSIRADLLERLRSLETADSQGSLAQIAYQRARDALSRALEEARNIRLQALEEARNTRERELRSLADSLQALKRATETEIESLLTTAELEAARTRDQAKAEADIVVMGAKAEAEIVRAEATALRTAAEQRVAEITRLEAEFNSIITELLKRLGFEPPKPEGGWFRRFGRKKK